jgi:predicted DNA-binding transcriptional regulator YafY
MSGGFPNCSALAEQLGVTSKTVQRDINFMRGHLRLPMNYADKKHGFFYKGDVADFPAIQMTEEEAATRA